MSRLWYSISQNLVLSKAFINKSGRQGSLAPLKIPINLTSTVLSFLSMQLLLKRWCWCLMKVIFRRWITFPTLQAAYQNLCGWDPRGPLYIACRAGEGLGQSLGLAAALHSSSMSLLGWRFGLGWTCSWIPGQHGKFGLSSLCWLLPSHSKGFGLPCSPYASTALLPIT